MNRHIPIVHQSCDESRYNRLLDTSITSTLKQASRIIGSDPALLRLAARLISVQRRSAARRNELKQEGIQVPAVVMVSLTQQCNLACSGCYMQAQHRIKAPEMTSDQLRSIISQCSDLGVSFIVLAGGEPLIRKDDILNLAREFPDLVFAVYTNGLLIDSGLTSDLLSLKNLVPVISIEGMKEETDLRRSYGVYDAIIRAFSLLKQNGVFFGCSVTVTRLNYTEVTSVRFVDEMIRQGCRFFSYVGYVPMDPETSDLVPDDDQHTQLNQLMNDFSEKYPAVFIAFPGDEEQFGGCLSAGRGFLHISQSGDLEPCPAAPFSDVNITHTPLKEALQSSFLQRVREHHDMLSEVEGGCALWKNREWVRSILSKSIKQE